MASRLLLGQGQGGKGQPGPRTAWGTNRPLPLRGGAFPGPGVSRSRPPPRSPRLSRCPVPAAGVTATRSLLRPPLPSLGLASGRSWLRSLRPRLEPESGRGPADGARCGEPSVGLLRAWLLWDNHSTEKGALVILPCLGDAGKEVSGSTGLSFIPQLPEEKVVCVNTHQRAR